MVILILVLWNFLSSITFEYLHCVKSVQIPSFIWSAFSCIWTKYRKIWTRKKSVLDKKKFLRSGKYFRFTFSTMFKKIQNSESLEFLSSDLRNILICCYVYAVCKWFNFHCLKAFLCKKSLNLDKSSTTKLQLIHWSKLFGFQSLNILAKKTF